MWRVGLFDLLHRRRRFVLAVIATSLAFGLSLLMAGTIAHLSNETDRIVALFKADQFVVADGGTGPFTTTRLLPASVAAYARRHARRRAGRPVRQRAREPEGQGRERARRRAGRPRRARGARRLPAERTGRGDRRHDARLSHRRPHPARRALLRRGRGSARTRPSTSGSRPCSCTVGDVQKNFLAGQPYVTAIAVRGDLGDRRRRERRS